MSKIQIGGNTYNARQYIKAAGGEWQAGSKTWSIDSAAWDKLVASKPILMSGCSPVGATIAPKSQDRPMRMQPVGPCRSCGSYCYGDCTA